VGVVAWVRPGYRALLDCQGRLTLGRLGGFAAGYGAVCAVLAVAWRGAFGVFPPPVIGAVLPAGVLGVWLSPLAIWAWRARGADGTLRRDELAASPGIVASWGIGVALLFPLAHPGREEAAERLAIAAISTGALYGAVGLLDRVALAHAGAGLGAGALAGWCGWRELQVLRVALHRAHLASLLGAVRAEALPAWIVLVAVVTGTVLTAALHVARIWRARSTVDAPGKSTLSEDAEQSGAGDPWLDEADTPAHEVDEAFSPEPAPRAPAGRGARMMVLRAQRVMQRAQRGEEAESAVASEVGRLKERGWRIRQSVWIPGVRMGDIDVLATGPSGWSYAIDAKGAANCTVAYDEQRRELVLRYAGGSHKALELLALARRQAQVLQDHGYGQVRPVLCYTSATVACGPVVDGVAVLPLHALVEWLEASDAQRTYATEGERRGPRMGSSSSSTTAAG
jgi:hypothetical protein